MAQCRRGYSLMELLVAIVIAGGLMWLLLFLFDSTARATRSGLSRSSVVHQAYLTELRMRSDESGCIGPDKRSVDPYLASNFSGLRGGMLAIIPAVRKGWIPVRNNDGGPTTGSTVKLVGKVLYREVNLRSDQLAYFFDADIGGLSPDGIGPGRDVRSLAVPSAASPSARLWYGHVRMPNESELADQWTLGRDALLLNPNPTAVAAPNPVLGFANPATDVPLTGPGTLLRPSITTDICDYRLDKVMDWLRINNAGLTDIQLANLIANPVASPTDYQGQLIVNQSPLDNQTLEYDSDVTSPRLVLATHCSEFIVQYATDKDCNGMVDTLNHGATWGKDAAGVNSMSNGDALGQLDWFPHDNDINKGLAAPTVPDPFVFRVVDGRLRGVRFGYAQAGPDTPTGKAQPYPSPFPPKAQGSIPYRQCGWPRLIRIRYRLHDDRGEIFTVDDTMLKNNRDDNGDGLVDEPGENKCAGIWFEHVFATPYPINPPFVVTPP